MKVPFVEDVVVREGAFIFFAGFFRFGAFLGVKVAVLDNREILEGLIAISKRDKGDKDVCGSSFQKNGSFSVANLANTGTKSL